MLSMRRTALRMVVAMCAAVVLGCGSGEDGTGGVSGTGGTGGSSAFEVDAIPDKTVVRNTITPRTVSVSVVLAGDAPEQFSVSVEADDATVVTNQTFECDSNPCPIEFEPSAAENATVMITLRVAAGAAEVETSFGLRVTAILVRDRTDDDPPPPDSLRDAIERAVDGDVIGFDVEGQFAEPRVITLVDQLTVTKDLTIEGTGRDTLTLDGGGTVRIFNVVSSSALTIQDMAFQEGFTTDAGGAVNVEGGGTLRAAGCAMVDGEAIEGGAIACDDCTVEITDCTFRGNSATDGGAIAMRQGTLTVDGSTFGGAESDEPNTALQSGGAIFVDEAVATVVDSMFIGNDSAEPDTMTSAGGGAIAGRGEHVLSIEGSRFEANTAANRGGAIHSRAPGVCSVAESAFVGNEASSAGAISYVGPRLSVLQSDFEDNSSQGGAAAIDTSHNEAEIADNDFRGHRGGSVLTLAGRGGPSSNSTDVSRITISDSFVTDTAVDVGPSANAVFEDLGVAGTTSQTAGAALRGGGTIVVRRAILSDNRVTSTDEEQGVGGAIFVFDGDLVLEDGELRGNQARRGGAIFVLIGSATLRNTIVEGNTAENQGGGLFVGSSMFGGSLTLTDGSIVRSNTAITGGGIFVDTDGTFSMTGGAIGGGGLNDGNTAQTGGGIFNHGDVILDGVSVNNNEASGNGGGMFQIDSGVDDAPTCQLSAPTAFSANEATLNGGGINALGGTVTSDSTIQFAANVAGGQGGAIFVGAGDISGLAANFVGNSPDDVAMVP